jgi:hypothetical protein
MKNTNMMRILKTSGQYKLVLFYLVPKCVGTKYPWRFYVRGWVDPRAIVRTERLSQWKICHAIRNRTGEPLPFSAIPPPTASLRTPKKDNADSLVNYEDISENITWKIKKLGTSRIEPLPCDGQSEAISRRSHIWRCQKRGKILTRCW